MAKVLIFNNFNKNNEDSILASGSRLHQYRSVGPGRWQANPYAKGKHIGVKDLLRRIVVCAKLRLMWHQYGVLIVDSAITALLVSSMSLIGKGWRKLVVSSFNVPRRRAGLWRLLAGFLFRRVDYFFVHSRYDIQLARQLYQLPESRFSFCPFVRTLPSMEEPKQTYLFGDGRPFIMSFGGNARDYGTFFKAIENTTLSAIVVAREYNLKGLKIPYNVRAFCNIPLEDCDKLVNKALFTVFTFDGSEPSCGQISIVTSFMLGKPTICTDWIGVRDYVTDGKNGLLVRIRDAQDLRDKVLRLASDKELYDRLSQGAVQWTNENTKPEAIHERIDNLVTHLTQ